MDDKKKKELEASIKKLRDEVFFSSLFHRITFSDLDPKNNFDLVCGCRLWSFESPYYNSAILDFDANDFDLIDLTQMIMI